MNIELFLLLIESILLIFTIILLFYSLKEGRERKKLLLEVGKATKTLTRLEYFLTVTDTMMEAKEEIIGCITGRPPIGEDKKRVMEIVEVIKKLKAKGVRVRYLLPKFHDRLYTGYLYASAGADVKYSSCYMIHSMRYIIVDAKVVVIGIPESIGEKEATRKGYRIPSEALASILSAHFNSCWKENSSFSQYVWEVIHQTGVSVEQLAHELKLDPKELVRILEKKV